MNAEIIAVGSELLTPSRVDTNSLYLTEQLNGLGVEVVAKAVIGDDRQRLAEAVRLAIARSQLVFTTGGLGPTEDDVTREAVADALGRKLVFREDIARAIEERFRRTGRLMPEINRRQAFVLEGAEILSNDKGTAPGQWIEYAGGRVVVLLPGPPVELKSMFLRECLPRLRRLVPLQVIRVLHLRVAGMPESELDQRIAPVYKRYPQITTTVLAAPGDIQVLLRARCETEEEAQALLEEAGRQIEALLGDRVYSREGKPLEEVVGELLASRGATVVVAESCTGGMLGARITSVPGSSRYFVGGFLTYSDQMKWQWLGVPPEELAEYSAVSAPVARSMAEGARARSGATYAVSVTGIAGPEGGTRETPVGTVFIGLAGPGGAYVQRHQFAGDRERIRLLATQAALDLLRRAVAGLPLEPAALAATDQLPASEDLRTQPG